MIIALSSGGFDEDESDLYEVSDERHTSYMSELGCQEIDNASGVIPQNISSSNEILFQDIAVAGPFKSFIFKNA